MVDLCTAAVTGIEGCFDRNAHCNFLDEWSLQGGNVVTRCSCLEIGRCFFLYWSLLKTRGFMVFFNVFFCFLILVYATCVLNDGY